MSSGEPFRPPRPQRPYAEFRLGFVLARSLDEGGVRARLDAVEATLGQLVRRWHMGRPLSPARDLRMAPETLDALLGWVETGDPDPGALARLGVYHSGAVSDADVPSGWIRVQLGAERSGPGELSASRG